MKNLHFLIIIGHRVCSTIKTTLVVYCVLLFHFSFLPKIIYNYLWNISSTGRRKSKVDDHFTPQNNVKM